MGIIVLIQEKSNKYTANAVGIHKIAFSIITQRV